MVLTYMVNHVELTISVHEPCMNEHFSVRMLQFTTTEHRMNVAKLTLKQRSSRLVNF